MTALYIILGVVLFFIAVLSIPVVLDMEYGDVFKLRVSWLFVKFNILPKDESKKKPKKEKKPKQEKTQAETAPAETPVANTAKKENPIKIFYEDQGVLGIVELINNVASYLGKFSKGFLKSIYIKKLRIRIWVTEGDAAQTAIKYGKFCQMIYPPLGFICSSCHVKDYDVNIWAEYCGDKTKGEFETKVALIPRSVINAGIAFVFRLVVRLVKALLVYLKAKKKNNNLKGGQEQ
ncbi:MAG: hypothetical protein IIX16_09270 [Clostridia bacterium]|nr:hypothetical protein [Clostridia bacterium]